MTLIAQLIGVSIVVTAVTMVTCCPTDDGKSASPPSQSASAKTSTAKPVASVNKCGHSQYYNTTGIPGASIVGGVIARQNEFPWYVRLFIVKFGTSNFSCGASIISERWLLTAAHCIDGVTSPSDITAYFGDYNRFTVDSEEFNVTILQIVKHWHFDWFVQQDYDFALLQLPITLNFSSSWRYQKICLPTSCSTDCLPGSYVQIAGFGLTSETATNASEYLRTATIIVYDTQICARVYSTLSPVRTITDQMMCAGYLSGGIDTCQGDSGGPLMINENGYYKLCGVTSFGEGCARKDFLGVYAKVCSVLDWISSTIA